MIRKILFFIVLVIFASAGITAFAYDEEISEENIELANVEYKKGVSLVKSKSYDEAIDVFKKALSYNPELADAYYNIASIYVFQKKYDEAYNSYVKLLALNPHDYDSILQVAKISYNRKNYALAIKYVSYIPEDYDYYYVAQQLKKDAQEMFDIQKNKIERAKISTATEHKKVIIDNFNSPAGIAIDSEGNLFVASYTDNAIIKIDKNKNRTNFAKDYLLDGPVGLAIDNYDNIYVANYDADNILKITKSGDVSIFMEKVAGPYFMYIKNDVLYVSEQGNDVILTYKLNSKI